VRKEDGSYLGAATKMVRARLAIEAEAMGLESALAWLDRFQDKNVIIGMDAKMIVQAVKTKRYPRDYWERIARRCGGILNGYPNVSLNWIRRTGNRVAHNLARWAAIEPNSEWNNIVPPQIAIHIQNDMRPG
jgi:ribonuclease HI